MKRILAVVAVIAFMGVLFTKPFDFISHYSQHASHAAHAVSTNPDMTPEQHILAEFSDARAETSHIGAGLWLVLISVVGIAAVVGGVVIKREVTRRTRQQGLL